MNTVICDTRGCFKYSSIHMGHYCCFFFLNNVIYIHVIYFILYNIFILYYSLFINEQRKRENNMTFTYYINNNYFLSLSNVIWSVPKYCMKNNVSQYCVVLMTTCCMFAIHTYFSGGIACQTWDKLAWCFRSKYEPII